MLFQSIYPAKAMSSIFLLSFSQFQWSDLYMNSIKTCTQDILLKASFVPKAIRQNPGIFLHFCQNSFTPKIKIFWSKLANEQTVLLPHFYQILFPLQPPPPAGKNENCSSYFQMCLTALLKSLGILMLNIGSDIKVHEFQRSAMFLIDVLPLF